MNKNYTLKELADIGAKAAYSCMPDGVRMCVLNGAPPHHVVARQAFTKAVLDAIGYEFPKDEEREAFERWWRAGVALHPEEAAFEAWKAGREELRKAVPMLSFDKNITITSEPDWIPWNGGDKSPIVGQQIYEVKYRDGQMHIYIQDNVLCWRHSGTCADIIAYRIIY